MYEKVLQVVGGEVERLGISYSGRFEPFDELDVVCVSVVSTAALVQSRST